MTRALRLPCLLLLTFALLSPTLASANDRNERAQVLLAEGNALLDAGAFGEALATFDKAYEIFPSPALLLNMGTALRGLERYAEANNHYNRWLAATRRPQHRSDVEAAIAELDRMVGRIAFDISELDATVTLDGREIDPRLYGNVIRVEPGTHTIAAFKVGFRDRSTTVSVGAGERRTARLVLERPGGSKPEPGPVDDGDDDQAELADTPPPDRAAPMLRIGGIAAAGVGLLSITIGLKFGLDARRLSGEVEQATAAGNGALANQKTTEGETANNRFIAFTAVGGAALVAGGVLYAIGHLRANDTRRDHHDRDNSLAIAPTITPDAIGLSISGGF
jgi:tetratricopeptide (TPR) repeat protein